MIDTCPLKISDKVYLLGSYEFNIYLLRGERCALIEGGVSTQYPLIIKQLNSINILPNEIDFLIVLHSHYDHIMTFPILRETFPWMHVVTSTKNKKIFNDEKLINKFKLCDIRIAQLLFRAGLGDGIVYQSNSPYFLANLFLQEGDLIDFGKGIELKILETPGHSPDAISLYYENEEILFVSDTIGIYYPSNKYVKPNYFYNLSIHEATLQRIQNIKTKILCKGHQGIIIGKEKVEEHIKMAFKGIEDFKEYVLKGLEEGRDENDLSKKFTDTHQSGISALFSWESNFRLTRLLIKRTLEYFNEKRVLL